MPYEPTNWKTGDLISSSRLNKIEQGIAALYPDSSSKTIVVCPEQTVTITSENTSPQNAPYIEFDSEYQGEFALPTDYRVYVNGELLEYQNGAWGLLHEDSNIGYYVFKFGEGSFGLLVGSGTSSSFTPEPGDYTVKIEFTERKFDENEIIFGVRLNEQNQKWKLDFCNKTPNEMHEIYESLSKGINDSFIFKVRIVAPYYDVTFETYPQQSSMTGTRFAISFLDDLNKKLNLMYDQETPYLMLSDNSITYGASKEEVGDDYYNPRIEYNPTNYKVEITQIEEVTGSLPDPLQ